MSSDEAIRKRIKHREDMFLRRLFGILAKMAKADGKIDAWETHAAEGAFARFERAGARRKFCAGVFNSAKNGRTPIERLAAEFAAKWATTEDCLAVYELLWDIACAKGVLRPVHKEMLRKVCVPLGQPPRYFEIYYRRHKATVREVSQDETENASERKRKTSRGRRNRGAAGDGPATPPPRQKTPLEEAYETLGCGPSDANDAVRRAYRNAAKRHHPDLLRAKGGSDAQIRAASEMMVRINAAWELVRRARGI